MEDGDVNIRLFLLILSILILGTGCTQVANRNYGDLPYEDFRKIFMDFKENFQTDDFISLSSPDMINIVTTSFPQNKIDTRQADIIDNRIENPARYEIYFVSKEKDLLIKLNFIYFPESKSSSFVSVHSVLNKFNSKNAEGNVDDQKSIMDEFIISQNGYLIIINFIDISNIDDNDYDTHRQDLVNKSLNFYKAFENTLLKVR